MILLDVSRIYSGPQDTYPANHFLTQTKIGHTHTLILNKTYKFKCLKVII